jgi:hypothetical protein
MPEVRLVKIRRPKGRPEAILEPAMFDRIIAIIKNNDQSKSSIIRISGFTKIVVTKIIKILLENGTIRKIGSLKGTTYKVRNDKKANKKHCYSKEEEIDSNSP